MRVLYQLSYVGTDLDPTARLLGRSFQLKADGLHLRAYCATHPAGSYDQTR